MLNLMILNCFMIFFLNHPLSIGMILLSQSILISLFMGMMTYTFWYSYIFLLIMIGGLLVLFIYMTSIASNEKFNFSFNLFMLLILMFIIIYLFLKFYLKINLSLHQNSMLFNNTIYNFNLSMIKYYNYPSIMLTFLIILYLLMTMIMTIMICNKNMGSLRQKF
uniref:NADH-ubiquinone oxidoreductase chain 6 n=1 Tax=Discolomatidae sp. 1 ACP-2013 TaxID=1434484 RepID=A0A3G5FNE2_9CUCU|nr:NADH dehydrogenase subunit 6 [Discolomatidae sp. 1 ACP-2013]